MDYNGAKKRVFSLQNTHISLSLGSKSRNRRNISPFSFFDLYILRLGVVLNKHHAALIDVNI
jgi:hypothetical protein